jgi:hypothetical protein
MILSDSHAVRNYYNLFLNKKLIKDFFRCGMMFLAVSISSISGCKAVPQFPQRAMNVKPVDDRAKLYTFDTNGDRKADYWQILSADGRKHELRFKEAKNDQVITTVNLNTIDGEVPHFIIALDGVPFELVQQLYDEGLFRLFYRPSRIISCFPSMTDLTFWKIFGGKQPLSYQAPYFDREKNCLISGNDVYLSGQAADWSKKLDYRCSFNWDAIAYLIPQMVFEHELQGMKEIFDKTQPGNTTMAYSVATAGLGTRGGREAILKYLRTIDQFCEQLVYERRGRVKITLLADHGQNMAGRERVTFKEVLEDAGYRLKDKIESPKDVVSIEFGLITYADFYTDDPAGVAQTILRDPAAELACYPRGNAVIVETLNAKAEITEDGGRFRYTCESGDPLALNGILENLRKQSKIDDRGFIDDHAFFTATVTHIYPDALRRIWLAFHGIVAKPADLIVCLRDGWVHGSEFFNVMIGGATSTHGSINRVNSTAFVLTMLGEPPAAMRPEEVMPAIERLKHP